MRVCLYAWSLYFSCFKCYGLVNSALFLNFRENLGPIGFASTSGHGKHGFESSKKKIGPCGPELIWHC